MAGQRCSSSAFQRFSVPAAAAAVRAWAASASQQFSVSAVKRSGCGGGGAWQGSVTAVQSFRASAFPLRRPRCVPGQRQRRSSSEFQGLSVAVALVSVPAQRQRRSSSEFQSLSGKAFRLRRRRCVAGQRCSSSEFQSLSFPAAAAAVRGWAALQQFRVSGLQRSRCGGRGACLGSVSVAAVQCFSV